MDIENNLIRQQSAETIRDILIAYKHNFLLHTKDGVTVVDYNKHFNLFSKLFKYFMINYKEFKKECGVGDYGQQFSYILSLELERKNKKMYDDLISIIKNINLKQNGKEENK